jgi:hypothetical protein
VLTRHSPHPNHHRPRRRACQRRKKTWRCFESIQHRSNRLKKCEGRERRELWRMRCSQVRFDHHCRNEAGDMSFAEFQEEIRIRKIAEEIQAFFDGCIPRYLDCTSCGRPRALHQEFPTANGSSSSVAPDNTSNKTQQSQTKQAPASVPTPAKSAAAKA